MGSQQDKSQLPADSLNPRPLITGQKRATSDVTRDLRQRPGSLEVVFSQGAFGTIK